MSNTLLNCFLNVDRPHLQHSSVLDLPVHPLGDCISSQLRKSFMVDDSDGRACAASARLWECVLEKHRLPYLLLKVADMRMVLGSNVTALSLYDELQKNLGDPDLECWISKRRLSILEETDKMLHAYRNDPMAGFASSQRWIPTARDSFPHCSLENKDIQDLHDKWQELESSKIFCTQFLNMHCLETNYIEGTFRLSENDNDTLVKNGFYNKATFVDLKPPLEGVVRSLDEVALILQDTHEALSEIYTFLEPIPRELTVELICLLHAKLMKTCRVLHNEALPNGQLTYTSVGVTRQTSRINVTASSMVGGQPMKIQFCPYDEVEGELGLFCQRFNEIIRKDNMDPFACAAWISHTFVAIHPFEDGNGRLSRILSSVPLVRKNLPPLCVTMFFRDPYLLHLNKTRATPRSGDYQGLMRVLYFSTKSRVSMLILDQNVLHRAMMREKLRNHVGAE